MGADCYAVFQQGQDVWPEGLAREGSWPDEGKVLARNFDKLNLIAKGLRIKSLAEYFSMDAQEAEAVYEDFGDDGAEGLSLQTEWFSAQEGLISVRSLLKYLSSDSSSVDGLEELKLSLQQLEQALSLAAPAGIPFYLTITI